MATSDIAMASMKSDSNRLSFAKVRSQLLETINFWHLNLPSLHIARTAACLWITDVEALGGCW
jgi:hypothetical protein